MCVTEREKITEWRKHKQPELTSHSSCHPQAVKFLRSLQLSDIGDM